MLSGITAPATVPWSKLVYESYRADNWDLYLANGDGSGEIRLTHGDAVDIEPRLNRGCSRIALASDRNDNYDIFTMAPDGSDVRRITTNDADDTGPAWSPDGSRIAFQSYRDGQSEIYVMNADGSAQTRLTWDSAYDGQPAWSPDGAQIAFTSRRSGEAIWLMGADGSNQRAVAACRYAQHPVWSPDGSQIAFDADGDNDEWNEIWLMSADGSDPRQVYDAGESTEAWVRTWSADGRYVGYTRISLIYYEGTWYWTEGFVEGWDTISGGTVRVSTHDTDWNPDWGTLDVSPPVSNMTSLPAESPYSFTVTWSGTDTGPAGLGSFDVQVRDGSGGTWAGWLSWTQQTSAFYRRIGGHTYFFRARARDNAGNLEAWPADYDATTAVEPYPPQTAVGTLPAYARGTVTVSWSGNDPGGSGIQSYDIQVRDGASGSWTDWQTGTSATTAEYSGEPGHTSYFRSRGADRAQNVESWPGGDGDAHTTMYTSLFRGGVTDNRGIPLAELPVGIVPAALNTPRTNLAGNFQAWLAANGTYTVTASQAGYGVFPGARLDLQGDRTMPLYLPPLDDSIANGGFESGSLAPWQASGELVTSVDAISAHTGQYGARLSFSAQSVAATEMVYSGPGISSNPSIARDGNGNLHVMWSEDGNTVYYRERLAGGDWADPVVVTTAGPVYHGPELNIAYDGTLHAIWLGPSVSCSGAAQVIHATKWFIR